VSDKKRILFYADSPTSITGFGNVARNLLREMVPPGEYHLTMLGVNFQGEPYVAEDHPYFEPTKESVFDGLWPARDEQSLYGFTKLPMFIKQGQYDIVFVLQDPAILGIALPAILKIREELEKKFKLIFYFPVDGFPRKEWVEQVISKVDYPVVYTEFGAREVLKIDPTLTRLKVIGHGSEPSAFFPIVGDARKMLRGMIFPGMPEDCFLVLNVNRNQPRKDFNRTFAAFSAFHKKVPNSFLFMHAAQEDEGGRMVDIAAHYGLVQGRDWSCPDPRVFNVVKGIPVDVLNQLYNAADLVISTTLGEGHGLSLTEAMSCKIPVLFPRHSAIEELIGPNEERGTLVRNGDIDHTMSLGRMDPIPVRPVVDVHDMVDKMLKIHRYRERYLKKAEVAYEWVTQHTWASKGIQWRELLAEALKAQEEENARQSESEQGTPDRGEAAAPSA